MVILCFFSFCIKTFFIRFGTHRPWEFCGVFFWIIFFLFFSIFFFYFFFDWQRSATITCDWKCNKPCKTDEYLDTEAATRGVLLERCYFAGHFLFLLRSATLLKKETLAHVFSCEFCEISKNIFFAEHICRY